MRSFSVRARYIFAHETYRLEVVFQADRTIGPLVYFRLVCGENRASGIDVGQDFGSRGRGLVFFWRRSRTYLSLQGVTFCRKRKCVGQNSVKKRYAPIFPALAAEIMFDIGTAKVEKLLGFGQIGRPPRTIEKKKGSNSVDREKHI